MKIEILVSVEHDSKRGNEITAERWKSLLEEAGHQVDISHLNESRLESDLLIGIHAVKCSSAIRQFKDKHSRRPVVVCLSGTDLHGVFAHQDENGTGGSQKPNTQLARATESLELADRIILLEPEGMAKIPNRFHAKCVVIFQSAERIEKQSSEDNGQFVVSVLGHLRAVKDPMRTATAARHLPDSSRVAIVHVGKILESQYRELAEKEMVENRRYKWVGLLEHGKALEVLANSQLTVLSSIAEGAPSVISEAIVNEVPIVASRIDASKGLLGEDYPGLFEVGDTNQLTDLMFKAENDPEFLRSLLEHVKDRKRLFAREGEKEALQNLVNELTSKD